MDGVLRWGFTRAPEPVSGVNDARLADGGVLPKNIGVLCAPSRVKLLIRLLSVCSRMSPRL